MPLKKRDGELILDWLEDIGIKYVETTEDVCNKLPSQEMKRFKLYNQHMMNLGISLWHGTSLLIPCDDLSFPEDDEIHWYRKDSRNKETLIIVSIYVYKKLGLIVKNFDIHIVDEMDVFPPVYRKYKKTFDNLLNLEQFFKDIKNTL